MGSALTISAPECNRAAFVLPLGPQISQMAQKTAECSSRPAYNSGSYGLTVPSMARYSFQLARKIRTMRRSPT